MTPPQAYFGKEPSASHSRILESDCFAHVPNANRTKWDSKSRKCIFLGYSDEAKGYHLFNPMTKKVLVSCDVVFVEPHQMEEKASFANTQE